MAFVSFSGDFLERGVTPVDNCFLRDYMPGAPENHVKVYLFGRYLLSSPPPQSADGMMLFTQQLKLSQEEVVEAFRYWEEMGIVSVKCREPLAVEYLPLTDVTVRTRRIKPEKYSDFSKQVQAVLKERMITPNEFNEYYTAIELLGIQPEAMVMIITYCTTLKGINVSYKYILAVANNFAHRGILTVQDVTNELSSYTRQSRDVGKILTALKSKRKPETEDNELYVKWTKEYGFDIDNILCAVSLLTDKKGGMRKLDAALTEYYRNKAFTVQEMTAYSRDKEKVHGIAVSVNRQLGVWYDVLEPVIQNYTQPWLNMGFDENGLLFLASYCMKKGIRTLEGMDGVVRALFKQGIVETESMKQHFVNILHRDKCVKAILSEAGLSCAVNNWHRETYNTWSDQWGLSDELITYAASISCGKVNPIPYMNAILGNWKNAGVLTVEAAKKVTSGGRIRQQADSSDNFDLNTLIDDIENIVI